ncbi:probable polygalacturonase At1g80170 [Ananas comosus]|uniref:endo-polygalacturonase n=1 Tax=Ananas comosus TaxID=4615 RepID=A0A6P5FFA7_ANACO|nr:probable polygalacturonase At1g80170 [Ananas comosus]
MPCSLFVSAVPNLVVLGFLFLNWFFVDLTLLQHKPSRVPAIASVVTEENTTQFNVLDFGAVGDGITDDSQAFLSAWNATCGTTTGLSTFIVPSDKIFLLKPLTFKGPCNSSYVDVQIAGTLIPPDTPSTWKGIDASLWLQFASVDGLTLSGSGRLNGRGYNWWQQSCRINHTEGCTKLAPTAIRFVRCTDVVVSNLNLADSPQTHVLIHGSRRVTVTNLKITAPAHSPNTDGIHIQSSQHVAIQNTIIGTGDDCISVGDNTYNIVIQGIACGPGHGISVGSLGRGGSNVSVEEIHVSFAKLFNTTNGVRIKTWQGGTGYAKSISFDRINFNNVQNPIIIDQYYCDVRHRCANQTNAVQISNVTYSYLSGTSKTDVAISLNCSQSVACTGMHFKNVNITAASSGRDVQSFCINAHGDSKGDVHPDMACLSM